MVKGTKMRNKIIVILAVLLCACAFFACNGGTETVKINRKETVLDIYAEERLEVTGEYDRISWSSDNERVVKVSDGTVIAQGVVGEAVITATTNKGSVSCKVIVRNQGATVTLSVDDCPIKEIGFDSYYEISLYKDCPTELSLSATYAGKKYAADKTFTAEFDDETVVGVVNGKLVGKTVGASTKGAIYCSWKGTEIFTQVIVTVYKSSDLFAESDVIDVYDVLEDSKKNRSEEIAVYYVRNGEKVENPELTITVTEGEEFVEAVGNTVTAKTVVKEEQAKIRVTCKDGDETLSKEITVKVHPNYIEKAMTELSITGEYPVVYEESADPEGKRNSVYRYYTNEKCANLNNKAWTAWGSQLRFNETSTDASGYKYNYIFNQGYRIISVDVYYTGEKGMSVGRYGVSNYCNVNMTLNSDAYFIEDDGVFTNTLVSNKWVTVYYALDKAINSVDDATLFILNTFCGDVTYLSSLKFYYDDAVIKNADLSLIDVEERTLTVDGNNNNKYIAGLNEFKKVSSKLVEYERTTYDGKAYMKYKAENAAANELKFNDLNALKPVHDDTGKAVQVYDFRYFKFGFVYKSGSPVLYAYNPFAGGNEAIILEPNRNLRNAGVKIFCDGAQVGSIEPDKRYDVVVSIGGKNKSSVYLTTTKATEFYLTDFAYYKDFSFAAEYGYNQPLMAENVTDNVLFSGRTVEVSDLIKVYYNLRVIENYVVRNVVSADESVARFDEQSKKINLVEKGETTLTITVEKDGRVLETECGIKVYPPDYVGIKSDVYYINLNRPEEYSPSIEAFSDGETLEVNRLTVEVAEGADVVKTENGKVLPLKVGEATVRYSFTGKDGQKISDEVKIIVWDNCFAKDGGELVWSANSGSTEDYAKTNEVVGGRTGVYRFSPRSLWNDKLDVAETNHSFTKVNADAVKARANMTGKGFKYVTVEFCLSGESDRIGIYAPLYNVVDGKYEWVGHKGAVINTSAVVNNNKTRIFIYDERGNAVDGAVKANRWYVAVIKYEVPEDDARGDRYACIQIANCKGTVYFDKVKYYTDDGWKNDFYKGSPLEDGYKEDIFDDNYKGFSFGDGYKKDIFDC